MRNLIPGILIGVFLLTSEVSLGLSSNRSPSNRPLMKEKDSATYQSVSGQRILRGKKPSPSRFVSDKKKSRQTSLGPLSSSEKRFLRNSKKSKKLTLGSVKKNNPLYRMGLRSNDVIERVNGKKVNSKKSFFTLLRRSKPGKKNTVSIERRGKKKRILYTVKDERTFTRRLSRSKLSDKKNPPPRPSSKKSVVKKVKKVKGKKYASKRKRSSSHPISSVKRKEALLDRVFRKKRVVKSKSSDRGKTVSRGLASWDKAGKRSQSSSDKTPTFKGITSKEKKSPPPSSPKILSESLSEKAQKKPVLPSFDELSKKEKKLLARKSKYLQKAYVLQMNSKIYEEPHFDAQPVYIVPTGGQILVSRKIFTPPSKFGTFYKVFIHKDKKIVGYISEIDVVSQFERGNQMNPRYASLKTQLKNGPRAEERLQAEKAQWPSRSKFPERTQGNRPKNRFAGLSLLMKWDGDKNIRGLLAGVKLSGRGFLSSLNMSLSIMSDVKFKQFYFDLLGIYELLKGQDASLYCGGGLGLNLERVSEKMTPELVGSLGLRTILLTGIFWQNELRFSYEFDISKQVTDYSYGFLTSFQFRF